MKDSFLEILQSEGKKPYFEQIIEGLRQNSQFEITPHQTEIFRPFEYFQVRDTKVIILGQDPYPGENVADGLAFSTKLDKAPASLRNIFKEVKRDYPNTILETNSLEQWAKQGVLLMNIYLTGVIKQPLAHEHIGWDKFTEIICLEILSKNPNVVVVALGKKAQKFVSKLSIKPKYLIESSHPSPLSYKKGFENSHLFLKINKMLEDQKKKPINWSLLSTSSKEDK